MVARIYRPTKNAMQSGKARTQDWVLELTAAAPRAIDPLMGWTMSADTGAQVRLRFDTKEQAIAHARQQGLAYQVIEPRDRTPKSKSYSDNFKFSRRQPWSH